MDPTRELYTYTDDLFYAKDPVTAMRILLANRSSIEIFEKAGTEIMLERYENDCQLQPLVTQLREKFATLRRRQRKVEMEKNELSQQDINRLFKAAMNQVATKKRTGTKRSVDYSKFKMSSFSSDNLISLSLQIVKRAPRSALSSSVASSPNSTASSFISSSDSDVSMLSL